MIRPDVPEADYHAEAFVPPETPPMLSASIAKLLLERSPLHAHAAHPRLGGIQGESTSSMDRGTLLHKLLLGRGAALEVIEASDFRKKDAREARDAAREAGKLPVLAHELEAAEVAVEQIRRKLDARGVAFDGDPEVTVTWTEHADSGAEVLCRGRIDNLFERSGVIVDLKTGGDASPGRCVARIYEHGLDVQAAAYLSAIEKEHPEIQGRAKFVFVFVEWSPPYGVAFGELDGEYRTIGERRWRRAVNLWERCLREDRWPDYERGEKVSFWAPPWVVARAEEALVGSTA